MILKFYCDRDEIEQTPQMFYSYMPTLFYSRTQSIIVRHGN